MLLTDATDDRLRPTDGAGDAMRDQHVCVLGPPIEHRDSLMAMLAGRVASATWISDSLNYRRQHGPAQSRMERFSEVFTGTRCAAWLQQALEVIDGHGCSVMVAYWGTLPLADVIAIRKARPRLKIVLMLLCYPLGWTAASIRRQRLALSRAWPSLDGVLCPTPEMAEYLRIQYGRFTRPLITTLPPCWPAGFSPTQRPAPAGDRPNLIFAGRTDLSGATVHPGDDVRATMREILAAGIELHHGQSPETDDGHPLRKPFAPRPIVELIARMAAHDASLMLYNVTPSMRADRFDLTVPDRLLSSVAGGVPIAIPRLGYAAPKTYLQDYGAVLEFDSFDHLHRLLSDRDRVHALRERAWANRSRYSAQRQGERLASSLAAVLA